jgi:hypothetical protein
MAMGCPSSATLSNWLLAFSASALASYTTSAVPVERPLRAAQVPPPLHVTVTAHALTVTCYSTSRLGLPSGDIKVAPSKLGASCLQAHACSVLGACSSGEPGSAVL